MSVFLIDFGLGYYTGEPEDHAMDLHVLAQSLAGTADNPEALFEAVSCRVGPRRRRLHIGQ